VPMPWSGDSPPFGFSDSADTWLPMPSDWATLTVEAEIDDADSALTLYRQAIEIRHRRADFSDLAVEFLTGPPDVVTFRCSDGLVCVLNAGTTPVALPDGALLIASALVDGALAADSAAWLR
jgi:alpha-glucosidase